MMREVFCGKHGTAFQDIRLKMLKETYRDTGYMVYVGVWHRLNCPVLWVKVPYIECPWLGNGTSETRILLQKVATGAKAIPIIPY